jgi:3-oxoacyl-[acyl-carrier-protein] synthase II
MTEGTILAPEGSAHEVTGESPVVVTGLGVVTPIGTGTDAFWDGLMSSRSGAGPITQFDASSMPVRIACEVDNFDATSYMDPREVGRTDRFTQLAVAAASLAWEELGWEEPPAPSDRVGVIVGSGIGGLSTIEQSTLILEKGGPRRVSPFMVPKLMPNAAAGAIAMKYHLHGPNFAPSSACATGAHAIGEAYRYLRSGLVDVMVAGGTEAALTPLSVAAFARMGALSKRNDEPERASRPFDKGRDGFVFGEGAGVLILERRDHAEARGADILCEVAGYGASADGYHVTQPDPEGAGAALAMRRALEDAGATPGDIDYINAHGTGTPYNDRVETIAVKAALGVEAKGVPVSSTKSQTGHLLGAAGAVEAAACVLAITRGAIPGTINLEDDDDECDLDYVSEGPRKLDVGFALSNSFGFGGQNACLAFRKV